MTRFRYCPSQKTLARRHRRRVRRDARRASTLTSLAAQSGEQTVTFTLHMQTDAFMRALYRLEVTLDSVSHRLPLSDFAAFNAALHASRDSSGPRRQLLERGRAPRGRR